MNVGVCTTDFPVQPADRLFAQIAELGFTSVQLCFGSVAETGFICEPHFDIPPVIPDKAIDAIQAAADKYRLRIAACNGTFNMAHPDAALRAEGLSRFDVFARAVSALSVPVASLCSGTLSEVSMWSPHPGNNSTEGWDTMRQSMYDAAKIAEQYGIVLGIETEASNIIDTPAKARRILDEIGSPALKMILDGANLFLLGKARPDNVRPVLTEAFEAFGKDIVLAHGKDIAEGDGIRFVPTGEGIIDFKFMMQKLNEAGYRGDMMLHGIYDPAKMIKAIRMFVN